MDRHTQLRSGVDVTITAEPGGVLTGCTDNTGRGITGASIASTSLLFPGGVCTVHPSGVVIGAGAGEFDWSNGQSSTWTASVVSPGVGGQFVLEIVSTGPIVLHPAGSVTRPPLTGVTQVSSGTYHSCAVAAGGSVKCWGRRWSGALGNGSTASSSVPVSVSGITGANSITLGYGHSCVVLGDGTGRCIGANSEGLLGDGTFATSPVPVQVISGF